MIVPNRLRLQKQVVYPECDGKPMADNTLQFEWIVKIQGSLAGLFRRNRKVFVAGDLLWYPVKGSPKIRQAPDAMVVLGRPKGHRGSYRQWDEDDIPPTVVFEVLSPGNRSSEMKRKRSFYQKYGVKEYYVVDPNRNILQGWTRDGNTLQELPDMNGWVSPQLKIRFETGPDDLELYLPDGSRFSTYVEIVEKRQESVTLAEKAKRKARKEKRRAEDEKQRAEEALCRVADEKQRAESEKQRADVEKQRADDALILADVEKQRANDALSRADDASRYSERLKAQLRALGIDPAV